MKKYLIPLVLLVPVGILAYNYNLMTLILLAALALNLAFLLVAGIIRIFRSDLSIKWLRLPSLLIVISITGILIGLLHPLDPAILNEGTVSDKLAYAYKTDQADRMTLKTYFTIFNDNMAARDSSRLEQVSQLYNTNQISQPIDKFYAAFIFHHSKRSSLFKIAQELAGEAASVSELKDNYVVQWLAKATYDRWLVSLGKPQQYGTQDKFSISVE